MYAPLRRPDEYTYADYLSWDTDRRYELHEGAASISPPRLQDCFSNS